MPKLFKPTEPFFSTKQCRSLCTQFRLNILLVYQPSRRMSGNAAYIRPKINTSYDLYDSLRLPTKKFPLVAAMAESKNVKYAWCTTVGFMLLVEKADIEHIALG